MFDWVQSGAHRGRRVHLGSRGRRIDTGLCGFTIARKGGAWLIRLRLGSLGGHRFHSSSLGFTLARLVVEGSIVVSVGSLRRAKGSPVSFVFDWVPSGVPRGRRVSLGSLGRS